jgi:antitoxin component of RelBE/YafQ-DinJ toxin-antitoxin module
MPSPSKSQLNLSVDSDLKNQFKSLCDSENISLAKAFECFMANSIAAKKVLVSPSKSPSLPTESPSKSPSLSDSSPSIERLENTIKTIEVSLLEK